MGLVRVEIIMNRIKLEPLKKALVKYRVTGMTVAKVEGCGVQYGTPEYDMDDTSKINLLEKTMVILIMPEEHVEDLIQSLEKDLYTGHIGDGKIFVSDVRNAYRIRTGEEGYEAVMEGEF